MKSFFVYILKCRDNSYYTGHTDNLELRISEHQQGTCRGFTSSRLPVKVVFVELFGSRDEAIIAERQIKGWSRNKKEALIERNWRKIVELSNK